MILLCLAGGVFVTAQLLDLMLMGGRSASYRRARGRLYGDSAFPEIPKESFSNKQQFYALLNHLKRQGLVVKQGSEKGMIWKITSAGLQRLKLFKENRKEYDMIPDDKLKIIAYDIPERKKQKRAWLREVLKLFGFHMLQKSLWIGKRGIPENFLLDLRKKEIVSYVHIFEISKTGTIKELM